MAIFRRLPFLYLLAIGFVAGVGYFVFPYDVAYLFGSTLGAVLNEKFFLAFLLPIYISLRFGFVYASLLCALLYTVILHSLLQEYWAALGIYVSYSDSFFKALLGSSIFYALINLIFGRKQRQIGKSG